MATRQANKESAPESPVKVSERRAKWRTVIPEYRPFYGELLPLDYVVFDLETSGLSPDTFEIIEIGAIRFKDGKEEQKFQTYVKPCYDIPHSASAIHGITNSTVQKAPKIQEVEADFLNFIGDLPLVAHNARFDVHFLQTEFGKHIKNEIIDTLRLSRELIPELNSYKLGSFKRLFNIDVKSHNALDDCIVTARLYQECQIIQKNQWLINRPQIDLTLNDDSLTMTEPQILYYRVIHDIFKQNQKNSSEIRASFFKNQKDFEVCISNRRLFKIVFQKSGTYIVLHCTPDEIMGITKSTSLSCICNPNFHDCKIALSSPDELRKISKVLCRIFDDVRNEFQ